MLIKLSQEPYKQEQQGIPENTAPVETNQLEFQVGGKKFTVDPNSLEAGQVYKSIVEFFKDIIQEKTKMTPLDIPGSKPTVYTISVKPPNVEEDILWLQLDFSKSVDKIATIKIVSNDRSVGLTSNSNDIYEETTIEEIYDIINKNLVRKAHVYIRKQKMSLSMRKQINT